LTCPGAKNGGTGNAAFSIEKRILWVCLGSGRQGEDLLALKKLSFDVCPEKRSALTLAI
jgi:hypothetical protein